MQHTSLKQTVIDPPKDIRVFVTYYEGSKRLAEKLYASALATSNSPHKFIFVSTDMTEWNHEQFPARTLLLDLPRGNPIAINKAFTEVARICYDNKDDFIFLDSDCTFIGENVQAIIANELYRQEGSALGQPIWEHNINFMGWSCNGNAAYRWHIHETFELTEDPIPETEPYDLFLGSKFFQEHYAPSHRFFSTLPVNEMKDLSLMYDGALIHHSCKDGSVSDLIVKEYGKRS